VAEEGVPPDEPQPSDEAPGPSEDDLRRALEDLRVADVLLQSLTLSTSLAYGRLGPESRDLDQVRLAIEALRALEPVLREGGVDESVVRDLEQARANLQLAYANAVSEPRDD
jgi:hypothetical protein